MSKIEVYAAVTLAVITKNKKFKRNRSKRSKQWLLKRAEFSHINLLNELKLEPDDWFNFLHKSMNSVKNSRETVRKSAILQLIINKCGRERLKVKRLNPLNATV